MALTDFTVEIPRLAKKAVLKKAIEEAGERMRRQQQRSPDGEGRCSERQRRVELCAGEERRRRVWAALLACAARRVGCDAASLRGSTA